MVFNMVNEDPGKVDYSSIGGLGEQIRELRESIELPLMNPELFLRVGIKPPKGRRAAECGVCEVHIALVLGSQCLIEGRDCTSGFWLAVSCVVREGEMHVHVRLLSWFCSPLSHARSTSHMLLICLQNACL